MACGFRLIGASASAKSGKFYAVDERYEPAIAERFRKWPEAAITYFGILVSPCKQRIQMTDAKVMVVKDRTLGTNDCRGWISRSVFDHFHLPGHRLYQFRLAFEKTQAKGACKVMPDDVSKKLGADIILPESCVKPRVPAVLELSRLFPLAAAQGRDSNVPGTRGIRHPGGFKAA